MVITCVIVTDIVCVMLCCVVPPHLAGLYDYCRGEECSVFVCHCVILRHIRNVLKTSFIPVKPVLVYSSGARYFECFVSHSLNESFDITYMD